MSALRWWWHWFGWNSPMGIPAAAFLTDAQIVVLWWFAHMVST